MMRRSRISTTAVAVLAVVLVASACGGDSGGGDTTGASEDGATSPAEITSEEVCALLSDAEMESLVGRALPSVPIGPDSPNVGFVPTLHLEGEYRASDHWRFGFDFDGLAGGPGRLLELTAKAHYDIDDDWTLGVGYRTLEGGADTDSVFAFAWLHTALFSLSFRF